MYVRKYIIFPAYDLGYSIIRYSNIRILIDDPISETVHTWFLLRLKCSELCRWPPSWPIYFGSVYKFSHAEFLSWVLHLFGGAMNSTVCTFLWHGILNVFETVTQVLGRLVSTYIIWTFWIDAAAWYSEPYEKLKTNILYIGIFLIYANNIRNHYMLVVIFWINDMKYDIAIKRILRISAMNFFAKILNFVYIVMISSEIGQSDVPIRNPSSSPGSETQLPKSCRSFISFDITATSYPISHYCHYSIFLSANNKWAIPVLSPHRRSTHFHFFRCTFGSW